MSYPLAVESWASNATSPRLIFPFLGNECVDLELIVSIKKYNKSMNYLEILLQKMAAEVVVKNIKAIGYLI